MIIALVLAAVLQSPTVDDHIAAFLKGDDKARGELVKLGAYAIRALQTVRDKAPEKADALIHDLKRGAAYPRHFDLKSLDSRCTFRMRGVALKTVLLLLDNQIEIGLRYCFDQSVDPQTRMTLDLKNATYWEYLDGLSRTLGVDYGFLFGVVVFRKAEYLWPERPAAVPGISAADRERVLKLIEFLDDESIESREAATQEIHSLGRSAISVLELHCNRREVEIANRCAAIIQALHEADLRGLGAPGYARQKMTAADRELMEKMQVSEIVAPFENVATQFALDRVKAVLKFPLETNGVQKGSSFTLLGDQVPTLVLLSVMTQANDLDFIIKEGKVVVDTRDAIRKLLKEIP